jgi:hypothetical protein
MYLEDIFFTLMVAVIGFVSLEGLSFSIFIMVIVIYIINRISQVENFVITSTTSNTYASDKAANDSILSQGSFDDLSRGVIFKKDDYLLTAGSSPEERAKNCQIALSKLPPGSTCKVISPDDESSLIYSSVQKTLSLFSGNLAMICCGKSTGHLFKINNGKVIGKRTIKTGDIETLVAFFEDFEFETFYLGGLFSIIMNNETSVSDNELAKGKIETLLEAHRYQRLDKHKKAVEGHLGDFVDSVLSHYEEKYCVIGGRPQKK